MRSMAMPSLSHQTESLERLNRALGLGEGDAVVGADGTRQAALGKSDWKAVMAVSSRTRIECFAHEQIARGVIGDGERITVFAVAELELAFEVGAPKIVRRDTWRQWRAGGARSRSTDAFDQAVAMQDGVDGALGGDADITGQAAHQELANLARAPVRLLLLERNDLAFDLRRQLVGVAHRAP